MSDVDIYAAIKSVFKETGISYKESTLKDPTVIGITKEFFVLIPPVEDIRETRFYSVKLPVVKQKGIKGTLGMTKPSITLEDIVLKISGHGIKRPSILSDEVAQYAVSSPKYKQGEGYLDIARIEVEK